MSGLVVISKPSDYPSHPETIVYIVNWKHTQHKQYTVPSRAFYNEDHDRTLPVGAYFRVKPKTAAI
jgi:hypothetical protein